jgi:hypothetical protein
MRDCSSFPVPSWSLIMKRLVIVFALVLGSPIASAAPKSETPVPDSAYGPAAALKFDLQYRGDCCEAGVVHCYPEAKGVPLADCVNIIPMTESLWTPAELCADFQRRMDALPVRDRKKGIIVMLKTERCATKAARACTITTAALEKRSTPLVGEFLIYGVQIKPRDGDKPPGSLPIETGANAWKNKAVGEYRFEQGPGATLAFLNPGTGSKIATTNAASLNLLEWVFEKDGGRTPDLDRMLRNVLAKIEEEGEQYRISSKRMHEGLFTLNGGMAQARE